MEKSIYTLRLQLHDQAATQVLHVKRRDTARQLRIHLADGAAPYTIAPGCYAMLTAKNARGEAVFADCAIDGDTIVYDVSAAATDVPGELLCQLRLYDKPAAEGAAAQLLHSPRFYILVADTVCTDEDEETLQVQQNALDALVGSAMEAAENANTAAQALRTAAANGEFNGEKGDKGDTGDTGPQGPQGEAGYTPVKGTDYYTEEEKAEFPAAISQDVAALQGYFTKAPFSPVNVLEGVTLTITEGAAWQGSGVVATTQYTSNYAAIDQLIDVLPGYTYKLPTFSGTLYFYDASGSREWINAVTDYTSDWPDVEFTVPAGKTKLGISYLYKVKHFAGILYRLTPTGEETAALPVTMETLALLPENFSDAQTRQLVAPLAGKTIVNFGDSIFGNYTAPNDISTMLADLTGATVYNCGFGGCRMASHPAACYDAFSMYNLADAIATGDFSLQEQALVDGAAKYPGSALVTRFPTTLARLKGIDFAAVDMITIAYGTNDQTGYPMLDSDTNPLSTAHIGGALRYSIEKLLTAYPHIKIFICSPLYRCWNNADGSLNYDSDSPEAAVNGVLLADVIAKEAQVAKEYHLPFIDNYDALGINRVNRYNFFTIADGAHPNTEGLRRIAQHIAKALF